MSILKLYSPINRLKSFGKDIWIVDGTTIDFALGRIKIPFTTRMTIIKLSDGKLLLHSPIQFNKELSVEISNLGEVKYLVSPNKIHYSFIKGWKESFPEAETFGSPKAYNYPMKVNYQFDTLMTDAFIADWKNDLDYHYFKGSVFLDEVVFFHKKSKTIIFTDLIENIEMSKVNYLSYKALMKVRKNYHPNGATPRDFQVSFVNRKTAKESFRQIRSWLPEKIILAHGKNFEFNGLTELDRAFSWLKL